MTSKASGVFFVRAQAAVLAQRLGEPRRFIQVVAGPRQVGKTTLVQRVLTPFGERARYESADEPTLRDAEWLATRWQVARLLARDTGGAVLALDEIQKIPGWAETVKRLWDEDTTRALPLRVVILGSAPLLVQQGLGESLAGRFEVIRLAHWSFSEMRQAFGFSLEDFLFFGGYPGAAPLVGDLPRWRRYIADALIETTLARDVLLLNRVDKPALLRRLFELGCRYSGQILSYTKMLGQLVDAGNTTTLAHYLELLGGAGMLTGLGKFAAETVRQRASSPKLQVLTTGLMTALAGLSPEDIAGDPEFRGRLVESAVGAHLAAATAAGECSLFYWRDHNREVDFVVTAGRKVLAIEVKSGRRRDALPGLAAFRAAFPGCRTLLVGADGIPLEDFLGRALGEWWEG